MSNIKFRSYGSNNYKSNLLEIDEIKILLDVGAQINQSVDLILLTHATLSHLAAFVQLYKSGLRCLCFATIPVHDMGILLFKDLLNSKLQQYEFVEFDRQDIEEAFESITILRYSQPHTLTGKCAGLRVTAFGAGHTIGGTVWKIKKDGEDIVYAIDYNHRKERHLNATVLMNNEALLRPSLLITDAISTADPLPRKERDRKLIGGNIIIPIETSTRVLELANVLDSYWQENRLSHQLLLLSHCAQPTINAARTMLEWMGDGVVQSFATRDLAFDFRSLKCVASIEAVDNLHGPKVVLVSFPSFEYGFGYDLLCQWGSIANNCIVFPERPPLESLGGKLYQLWVDEEQGGSISLDLSIERTTKKRELLSGQELDDHLAAQVSEEIKVEVVPEVVSDSDEEIEEATSFDIYVKDQSNHKSFFKQSQVYRMYPVYETRARVDDYGEVLDHSFYTQFDKTDEYVDVDVPEIVNAVEAPFKYVVVDEELVLKCLVYYIDFEGLTDANSHRNIIQQIAPRKMILVSGAQKSKDEITELMGETVEIFTPDLEESVSISVAKNIYQVILSEALVSSLHLSKLNDYDLAFVNGVIKTEDEKKYLYPIEIDRAIVPVSVGEIKLSELNKKVIAAGFETLFVQGGLVVDQSYYIRKDGGRIVLEGGVGEGYYKLRDLVYSFQAMLT